MSSNRFWQFASAIAPTLVTTRIFLTSTLLLNAAASHAWEPPIGIPPPPFGISESHTMYAQKQFDYNSNGQLEAGEAYRDAGHGPYSHYVDNTHSACTDDNNYGSPAKPRCRVPQQLPAGSVVEIRGRYNASHNSPRDIVAQGTADRPVFIRGASAALRPYISEQFNIRASTYLIIENLEFGDSDGVLGGFNSAGQFIHGGATGMSEIYGGTHHLAVRHCDIHGNLSAGGINLYESEDIVIYHNDIHDTGNYQSPDDNPRNGADQGALGVGKQTKRIWVVDNTCWRNGRACTSINPGYYSDGSVGNAQIQYVYVGRNVGRENRETNFWTKHASHVIFSQNTASAAVDFRYPNRRGGAMGFQYGPENVWFLFNHIYDAPIGIMTQGDSVNNPGQNSYFIGNIIHNIHHGSGVTYNPNDGWSGAAIRLSNGGNRHVIGNTIYDVDAGINTPSQSSLFIYDNIISNVTIPQSHHIFIQYPRTWDIKNCLFFQNGAPARIRIGEKVYSSSELINIGSGQGSITADPKFVNPVAGDFHIKPDSPAVNAALKRSVYDTFRSLYGIDISKDIEKVARPQGANFDVGAYESTTQQVTQVPAAPSNLRVLAR